MYKAVLDQPYSCVHTSSSKDRDLGGVTLRKMEKGKHTHEYIRRRYVYDRV